MNTILELREKRAKAWESAKAFLDSKRGDNGLLSAEDTAAYERMEADVVALGKEIERVERQSLIDAEMAKNTSAPLTGKPATEVDSEQSGRASKRLKTIQQKNFLKYLCKHLTFESTYGTMSSN